MIPGVSPHTHEKLTEGANFIQTTEIEQGETDDLRLSYVCHVMIDDVSSCQHTHTDLTRVRMDDWRRLGEDSTFLSDLDPPEPVQPVVYSPWMDKRRIHREDDA